MGGNTRNSSPREPIPSSGLQGLLHIHGAHKPRQACTHVKIISQFSEGQSGIRPNRICGHFMMVPYLFSTGGHLPMTCSLTFHSVSTYICISVWEMSSEPENCATNKKTPCFQSMKMWIQSITEVRVDLAGFQSARPKVQFSKSNSVWKPVLSHCSSSMVLPYLFLPKESPKSSNRGERQNGEGSQS